MVAAAELDYGRSLVVGVCLDKVVLPRNVVRCVFIGLLLTGVVACGEESGEASDDVAPITVEASEVAPRLFSERLGLTPCISQQLEPRYLMGSYAE